MYDRTNLKNIKCLQHNFLKNWALCAKINNNFNKCLKILKAFSHREDINDFIKCHRSQGQHNICLLNLLSDDSFGKKVFQKKASIL